MQEFYDEKEVRKAISLLKPDGQLFEIRVLSGKKIFSGYFTDADTLIEHFKEVDLRKANVYFTLNKVNEACYSRDQHNCFKLNPTTTSDTDITSYQWMMLDFDPVRPTGISSTKQELEAARNLAVKVYHYLRDLGFEEPIQTKSGNGYHLLYKIQLEKNDDNQNLIKRCLETLADLFDNEQVKVDLVNYNPSRICKLPGTLAQKGANTEERPHRMSGIISQHREIKTTKKIFLQKLCDQIPHEEPTHRSVITGEKFDIENFMREHGLVVISESKGRDNSRVMKLEQCPFDSSHQNGDARIIAYPDGRIAFKCQHNSCSRYKWQDLRERLEPGCYDKPEIDNRYEDGWRQHNRTRSAEQVKEIDIDEPMFRTAREIYEDDEPQHEFVLTGITEIDSLMHGLEKQCISVMSGLRASGKSTLIGNIICNAIDAGHRVVVYSGEMSNKKYLSWLLRQAAGKNGVEVSTKYQNGVGVPHDTEQKIINWMGDLFWLYNNRHGNNFEKLADELSRILKDKKADLCIVDNLMALDLSRMDADKYDAQTKFILALKSIAIETNTHILCVAHPKKTLGFIRLDDISGTSNLGNAVDAAFMVHRCNADFAVKFKALFPDKLHEITDATNVIEIAKDRENGTMDKFIPLFYEESTKRLRNTQDEFIHYGWESREGFVELPGSFDLPF